MISVALPRIDELREFEKRARMLDTNDEPAFRAFLGDARVILEKSEGDIADFLTVSRPTLNRWINGRSTPHPLMRPVVVSKILGEVSSKVSVLASYSRGSSSYSAVGGRGRQGLVTRA